MMIIDEPSINKSNIHPFVSIISLTLICLVSLIMGSMLSAGLLQMIYGYSITDIKDLTNHPEKLNNSRMALLLNHAIGTILFAFVFSSYIWKKMIEKTSFSSFFNSKYNPNTLMLIGLAISVTIVSMPINSVFIYLNKGMVFPEFLSGMENRLKEMEASAERIVSFLIDFQNPNELIVAVIVMGALTGIGEELLFRGALQSKLYDWTRNPHIAIWIAAIIFSAIHGQFYGFIPRMLLAAMFGYLYFWSGNLWIPIISHATNNTVTILALYYYKNLGITKEVLDSNEMMPIPTIIISLVLTIVIMYQFRKKALSESTT